MGEYLLQMAQIGGSMMQATKFVSLMRWPPNFLCGVPLAPSSGWLSMVIQSTVCMTKTVTFNVARLLEESLMNVTERWILRTTMGIIFQPILHLRLLASKERKLDHLIPGRTTRPAPRTVLRIQFNCSRLRMIQVLHRSVFLTSL